VIAATDMVDFYAAQIRPSRELFEHAALAHNKAPAAVMRLDAIHVDALSMAPTLP
jgi:hypothetical protein